MTQSAFRSRRWLAAALIFVALNLRIAIGALPPVLSQIRHDTGLSSAGGGLLSAVPVFCFGLVALAAPQLIARLRMRPLLSLTMVAVAGGCVLRLASPLVALFVGTALLGAGIAIGNVLVPGLIKRDFAARAMVMTALYSVALNAGAAISAGLTVPIEHGLHSGWRPALAVWALPALLAFALWTPFARHEPPAAAAPEAVLLRDLMRDRVAWSVTLVMGVQSFGYYATLSWLPTIFEDHGISAATAGGLLSYSMFPAMLAAVLMPTLLRHTRRPALLVVAAATLTGSAYAGLLVAPASIPYLWMTLLGLGGGISLTLALSYIVARAPDGHHAAQLSTMAQSMGYLIASTGPFILGALHGLTGGWTVPMAVLLVTLVPWIGAGLVAGQDRHVLEPPPAHA
ncbi:MAG: CynX/NimT family MFS transporter [Solirubrobacteraceae bacterium]